MSEVAAPGPGGSVRKLLAGRYRLLSVVGRGGMGTVWRAYDVVLDREVAAKEVPLPSRLTAGERAAMCRRLIGEARTTAALRHPGVVTVHDVVDQDGRPWIVMEYLRARSLHEEIGRRGPLPVAEVAKIGLGVLAVLRSVHDAGVLHRDIKPSNVLLTDDGRVIVTDFGLAAHVEGDQQLTETMAAGIEGSPAYLSPERVRGDAGSAACDLWSLGALLYTAVEGRPPYQRCHALATMVAVLLGEYEPPRRGGPLRPVIDGLLRSRPEDRLTAVRADRLLRAVLAGRRVPLRAGIRLRLPSVSRLPVARPPARRRSVPRRTAPVPVRARAAPWAVALWPPSARVKRVLGAALVGVLAFGAGAARGSAGSDDTVALVTATGAAATEERRGPGFRLELPVDWTVSADDEVFRYHDTERSRRLEVRRASGDGLTGLVEAERRIRAEDGLAEYRRLRLERVPQLAAGAAEWEYVYRPSGAAHKVHVLRTRVGGFDLAYSAPHPEWTPSQRIYDTVLRTFRAA